VSLTTKTLSTYPIKLTISYSSCGVRGTNYTNCTHSHSVHYTILE